VRHFMSILASLYLAGFVAVAAGLSPAGAQSSAETAPTERKLRPYPLDYCIVSGETLTSMGGPVIEPYGEREMCFCCTECISTFERDVPGFLRKIDAVVIAEQRPNYPLDQCLVNGRPLSEPDGIVEILHGDRLVRFCSAACRETLQEQPQAYLKKLDQAAIAAQFPEYPLDVCVVSGMALGSMGEPVDHLHQAQLVRFCCAGCLPTFAADPQPYLEKIDAARGGESAAEETAPARDK